MLRTGVIVVAVVWVGMVAGCAQPKPTVTPEPPGPLEVPVAPPRVLAPVMPVEAPAPPPPAEPRIEPKAPPRPRPATPRPTTGSTEPRPDTSKTETGPPEQAATPPAPEPAKPQEPTLKTPQTANDAEAERRVRDVLARARGDLEGINRAQLSADARAQFDTARRFIDQANDALKVRNYMFAAYLADKAETLAGGLAGR